MKPGKRNKKNQIGEPFVAILKHMIKSPAFKQLTNASRVTYLLLRSQITKYGQREVIFPYSDAEHYMKRQTFARSIKQLEKYKFIEISDRGGLYRRTNIYRFVEGWREIKK
jgi:hypothetical protein